MKNLPIPNRSASLMLAGFFLVTGLATGIYGASGAQPSPAYSWLFTLGWIYVLWYWMRSDCQRLGIHQPLDLGFFVMAGWPVAYPYYLIKTRGWGRGLLWVGGLIGLYIAWYLFVIVVALAAEMIILMANLRPGSGL